MNLLIGGVPMRASRWLASLVLLFAAMPLQAQMTVNVYPREVAERRRTDATDNPQLAARQQQRFTTALQEAARAQEQGGRNVTGLDSAALAQQLDSAEIAQIREQAFGQEAARNGYGWGTVSQDEAADLWPKLSLLPSASVQPGSDRTALFTELAQTLSGGWRFSLATALAVETGGENDEASEAEGDEADQDADARTGFRRFLAGGGNLSLTATRPIALRGGTFANQLLFFSPRIWSNIPTLKGADAVDDFGGEIAGEYQYLLYPRIRSTDPLPDLPFLALQVHTALVLGTNSFYRTIGHDDERMFAYTVPSLNLQFNNGVKLGVAYFYAFGDFSEHENLRFQIGLSPPKKEEANR